MPRIIAGPRAPAPIRCERLRRLFGAATLVALVLAGSAQALAAQGLLRKATDAVRETGVGRAVSGVALEARMVESERHSLDHAGLVTVPVGSLVFGVAAVEIAREAGVRVVAYLYNPGAEAARLPVPDAELLVLVDDAGRRLERASDVEVEARDEATGEIVVPALERVSLSILYALPEDHSPTGLLKVADLGIITGIPLQASAVPTASGAANPWTRTTGSSSTGGAAQYR